MYTSTLHRYSSIPDQSPPPSLQPCHHCALIRRREALEAPPLHRVLYAVYRTARMITLIFRQLASPLPPSEKKLQAAGKWEKHSHRAPWHIHYTYTVESLVKIEENMYKVDHYATQPALYTYMYNSGENPANCLVMWLATSQPSLP